LRDIAVQLAWNRLIAVVEEQARTLMKTSFSAVVRESGDLSAGVFDLRGRMIAQAVTGTPGHVNAMAAAVRHFIERFPVDTMEAGDHFITNDPWLASGHLHDVTVVTPAFFEGRPVALFACTCHQVDIGGRGQGPDGRSIYEEGLFIPLMRLARRGVVNDDLMDIVRANVRTPHEVEGDILSYVSSNDTGAARLAAMMREFGLTHLEPLADHILARSEAAMVEEIRKLPEGTFRNRLVIDGYDRPVELECALTIGEGAIIVDYAGSSPASPHGINLVLNYCRAYTAFGVRCVIAPQIPNNAGSLAPISVSAPNGSILNVERPWPVCARHVIGQFLPDVVMGCLAQVVPERVPAEGASCVWGAQLRGGPEIDAAAGYRRSSERAGGYELIFFNSGGSGARRTLDGLSATAFPSGVRAMPTEVVEALSPIVIWRKELRADSAGAGATRGGFGQSVEVASRDDGPFAVSAMFDRVRHAARGRVGGRDGAPGRVSLACGTPLASMGLQIIPAGERLRLDLPGGGGYGDPLLRDPALVMADVHDGLIGREAARAEYGVAITPQGTVDEAATAALRRASSAVQ
jgi:N-methylhydantoinase B/oxoprolinase/acetone carboxylase alpha subunit